MKIVIIEDDPMMYRLYQRILEQEKHEVTIADNAKTGIEKVNEILPDTILLDIMMPNQDGIQTLKQLKKQENTKHIPVIMLTNLGIDNVINEAFKAGASGYLIKSQTSNEELLQQIKKIQQADQKG